MSFGLNGVLYRRKERKEQVIRMTMVEKFREECRGNDEIRDAGVTEPEDVERFDDIPYGPDAAWNVLDVYRPKGKEGMLPVIVSVHGGGWVYGNKELYRFYGMALAQQGFGVVNFTYRLAPEHKFPAQMEDINLVMEWILENGERYGLDVEHIFFVGDSAGAHLAGLYTCVCTNPAYASGYAFRVPAQFVPKAVALNCGVYIPVPSGEKEKLVHDQVNDLPKALMPEGCTEKEAEFIDVTRHITSAFPPVFLMTATEDFCKPQAFCMEEVLKGCGVPYSFKIYGSEENPLHHVFHVDMHSSTGRECNEEECAFFRGYL